MVGKILVTISRLFSWAPHPATHSFSRKGFGKVKSVTMPMQPCSTAQSIGKQSVTKKTSAKKPNSFRGKSDRQFSNRLSPNRLTDWAVKSATEDSIWATHSGQLQAQPPLKPLVRQAMGIGAHYWRQPLRAASRLGQTPSQVPRNSQSCPYGVSETTVYERHGNLVTISESGIQRTRENNFGGKSNTRPGIIQRRRIWNPYANCMPLGTNLPSSRI